jgi:imidazolonepropionase-like amidohydrolase
MSTKHAGYIYWLVCEGELATRESLRSTTSLTAKRFGLRIGEFATGNRADFVTVEADPANDI